jgi:hypothetical protein
MTPENRNAINAAIDELKRAIVSSMGEGHESAGFIEQIENTLSTIEQKSVRNSLASFEASFSPEQALIGDTNFSGVLSPATFT